MATRYLYIIRHGQYNPYEDTGDDLGGTLTQIGVWQARMTAHAVKHLPVTSIYYSTMRRAEQTAEPILAAFPEVPHRATNLLWECIPALPDAMLQQMDDLSPETIAEDHQRASQAFDLHFDSTLSTDKHEILITHGNLMRYFVTRVLGLPETAWLNLDCHNCGLTRIKVMPEGYCRLVSYNDLGHLPVDMRTNNTEDTPKHINPK